MKKNKYNIFLNVYIFFTISLFSQSANASSKRYSLVIGNSRYKEISTLANSENDAKAINEALTKIGFDSTLLLNASEQELRKEIRSFSKKSESASISMIFYAGHGAQISGENYILPIDMDIPKRDADIQLSALKVDDLINSLKSDVKIVFLDACRDNPALIKNLTKGRGKYRSGLAPIRNEISNGKEGGIFIAYATDSDSVALDGDEKNSPFTSAVLRHISKPISIDDMFSMVTKEVRLSTKGEQRPYKYASLDGIVCLTDSCGNQLKKNEENNFGRNTDEESNDYKIAIESQNKNTLSGFLEKYPNSKYTAEINNILNKLNAEEDWLIFSSIKDGEKQLPVYFNTKSINKINDRILVKTKDIENEKTPRFDPKLFGLNEKATEIVSSWVISCKKRKYYIYEVTFFDKNSKKTKEDYFSNPELAELKNEIIKDSISENLFDVVCSPNNYIINSKNEKYDSEKNWKKLYILNDSGAVWLNTNQTKKTNKDIRSFNLKIIYPNNINLGQQSIISAYNKINLPIEFRYALIDYRINCKNQTFAWTRSNLLTKQSKPVAISNFDLTINESEWAKLHFEPFDQISKIVCKK